MVACQTLRRDAKRSAAKRAHDCWTPPSWSSKRAGANSADINAIVEAAGVARSTFYFHFPTKEHVLLELIRRDEDYLAEELSRFLDTRRDLPAVLDEIIRLVVALENRWGASCSATSSASTSHPHAPRTNIGPNTRRSCFLLLRSSARVTGASSTTTSTRTTALRSFSSVFTHSSSAPENQVPSAMRRSGNS